MTLLADTLVCDTTKIAAWQADSAYQYNRELLSPEVNLMGLVQIWLGKVLQFLFGNRFAEEYTGIVLIVLLLLILLCLLWFLYRKRPELFLRAPKHSAAYHIHEDTIYGISFDECIEASCQRGDYREAIRLLYLQTLKQLSDGGQLNWQPHKTPTEYFYEVKDEALRSFFRSITNNFLRVRYGNFEATLPLFDRMRSDQHALLQCLPAALAMKGGVS